MGINISSLRNEYKKSALDMDSVEQSPFDQFEKWFDEAQKADLLEPNAMVLSTTDQLGNVTQRTVLLKEFGPNGFVFFTNYGSRKATQIELNSKVSMLFPWLALERQIIIVGTAIKTTREESKTYFNSRPYSSQLGALASDQSTEVPSRTFLEEKIQSLQSKFPEGNVPYPENWGGYRIQPASIEFWQGRPSRLHDRIMYELQNDLWITKRLSP